MHGRHQLGVLLLPLALELRHLRLDLRFIHERLHGILDRRISEVDPTATTAATAATAVIPSIPFHPQGPGEPIA